MGGTEGHYAKWKKPDPDSQVPHDLNSYTASRIDELIEVKNSLVVTGGLGSARR